KCGSSYGRDHVGRVAYAPNTPDTGVPAKDNQPDGGCPLEFANSRSRLLEPPSAATRSRFPVPRESPCEQTLPRVPSARASRPAPRPLPQREIHPARPDHRIRHPVRDHVDRRVAAPSTYSLQRSERFHLAPPF